MREKEQVYGAAEIKIARAIEKRNNATTIEGNIQYNNKATIGIMIFLVVFSVINLIMSGYYGRTMNIASGRAKSVEEFGDIQNELVTDIMIAVVEGKDYSAALQQSKSDFNTWYEEFDGKNMKTEDSRAAFASAMEIYEQVCNIAQENIGVTMQSNVEQAIAFMEQIAVLNGEFGSQLDIIASYYTDREMLNYNALKIETVVALIICIVLAVFTPKSISILSKTLALRISKPIQAVADWSIELSRGSDQVEFDSVTSNIEEVNLMIEAFKKMALNIEENVHVVQRVAEGDMTAFVNIHSSDDSLAKNLYKMVQNNDIMFNEITKIASDVANGATDIANASNSLAQSCTTQVNNIADFKETIEQTSRLLNANVERIRNSKDVTSQIKQEIMVSNEKMQELLHAMEDITEASEKISAVIQTIEEIASQTNLLALNASIEAARAGEAGKGFAVVANEVSNLASQSASAVVQSRQLIEDTKDKANRGNRISNDTFETFNKIVESVDVIYQLNDEMNVSGEEQKAQIKDIERNMKEISDAVDANAAISEQTAASCDLLNERADELRDAMGRFNLRQREPGKAYIPPEKRNDAEFIKQAQKNYEEAVQSGRV